MDGESLDCESTGYDGCMTDVHCRAGGCDAATQRKIARFLACFEGPYANREVNVDASLRIGDLEAVDALSDGDDPAVLLAQEVPGLEAS